MVEQDKEKTLVIFRRYYPEDGGAVIALFPEEPGTSNPDTFTCYQHIGQHGTTHRDFVDACTLPISADDDNEVRALYKELERLGYNLVCRQRISGKMNATRIRKLYREPV